MSVVPKKYFYDKIVLLLLSILAFLVVTTILSVLIRVSAGNTGDYFVEYRSSAGISAFQTGDIVAVVSFVVFVFVTFGFATVLSMKTFRIKRELSLLVLSLGIVLTLVAAIVSNALLALR